MTAFDERLPSYVVYPAVSAALREDLGDAGDITTNATVPAGQAGTAEIVARTPGRIAGLDLAEAAFKTFDHDLRFETLVPDGGQVERAAIVARVEGSARAMLMAERVALNFLCHLSGIATLTAAYVHAVQGTKARIVCTRKTLPGLRALQKYAVRAGGGMNHRFGLYDAVLIKDNHIAAAGGMSEAIARARARAGHMVKIEAEVTSIEQLNEALRQRVDVVMLDNMDVATMARAVGLVDGRAIVEASGGVNLDTVRRIAETGVDLISVGALTHSPKTLDLGLDWA